MTNGTVEQTNRRIVDSLTHRYADRHKGTNRGVSCTYTRKYRYTDTGTCRCTETYILMNTKTQLS